MNRLLLDFICPFNSMTTPFSILFFGLLVYKVWEATLDASLLVRKVNLPFDGLETLLLNSDYRIATFPDSAYTDSFKFSKVPERKKAWSERIEPYMEFYEEYFEGKPTSDLLFLDNFTEIVIVCI